MVHQSHDRVALARQPEYPWHCPINAGDAYNLVAPTSCWACCTALTGSLGLRLPGFRAPWHWTSVAFGVFASPTNYCTCMARWPPITVDAAPIVGSRLGVMCGGYLQPMQSFDSQICSLTPLIECQSIHRLKLRTPWLQTATHTHKISTVACRCLGTVLGVHTTVCAINKPFIGPCIGSLPMLLTSRACDSAEMQE